MTDFRPYMKSDFKIQDFKKKIGYPKYALYFCFVSLNWMN